MDTTVQARPCALITGAANGIGRATAQLLAQRGWVLGVADVDLPALETLVRELGPDQAMPLQLDVTDAAAWEAALAALFARWGRLDLLLNNAGILISGPFAASPLARHHALVDVNVKGVLNGCHAAKPYLMRTPGARVINLSSASAVYGQADLATYSATKFAVRGLTEALNIEWQRDGIRVMDVMPLFVNTAMVKDMDAGSVRRLGVRLTPQDVARVICKAAAYHGGLGKVHWPVGWMARLLHGMNGMAPDGVSRFIAQRIAG